jgi:diguanylate cyclase (GGDEF)-like protein
MTTQRGPSSPRRAAVWGITLASGGAGAVLTAYAAESFQPLHLSVHTPWLVLLPLYLLALQLPLEYEFKRETRMLSLTHIPMTLGLLLVAPWWHLAARAGANALDVAARRQPPMKCAYNIAVGSLEVGIASAALALVDASLTPGPSLWLSVMGAMLLIDLATAASLTSVLALVGVPQTRSDILSMITTSMTTTLVFAGLGIMAIAAALTDPATLAIVAVLVLGLGLGYRRHRRLGQEAQQQAELQQFLKGLGPLDLDVDANSEVLEHVRLLLHAEQLELSLREGESWTHITSAESGQTTVQSAAGPVAPDARRDAKVGPDDHMSAPLLHHGEMVGVLTVRERMGEMRRFGVRDLRLVEIVASELAKAIDRGQLQRQLGRAATTDLLTSLPNLNETSRLIDLQLRGGRGELIVAAIAVDSFREVNDTLGHQVGDELLLEVTRRLGLGYSNALVGRIGGGRFAIAVPSDTVGGDPSMFGLGIRAQVEGGAQLGPVGTHIRLSVGCVSAPEHGDDAATLIRRAETAMYSARHAHGGPVVWEPVYEVEGQRRLAVVMALREALSSGAIGVAYQPKLSANGAAVTGVEALARWTHPALGAISPAEFIPLAEAAGLMGPLTSTVLRQALTACKGWQRRGGRVGVAVNVSADTILDPTFVTEVAAILTSINISPDLLTLELTEGVVVNDPELAVQRMTEMRALGVKISVDDFGTGYSSLTYLKGLPVDEVKIDKGFVDDIAHDAGDRAVVRAVVDIAHTLGLRVVAEGVEHVAQGELLEQLGVDEVQGYLHARPMAALDVAQWLRRREDSVKAQLTELS